MWLLLFPVAGPVLAASEAGKVIDVASMDSDRLPLNHRIRYYRDDGASLGIDGVLQVPASQWQVNGKGLTSFGYTDDAYWFHLPLEGLSRIRNSRFFHIAYSHIDRLDLFKVQDREVTGAFHTGDTRPFATRPREHRQFLLELEPSAGDRMDLYVRVASDGPITVPMALLNREGMAAQERQDWLRFGAYFGIMLLMLAYNGVIFLFVREKAYFFYLLYIAAAICLQFTLNGLGLWTLWPEIPSLNNTLTLLFAGLMPFAAILFVWHFVGLGRVGSRPDQVAAIGLCLGFGAILLGTFTLPYATTLRLTHLLAFLSVTFGFYIGVKYWIKGIKAARIFALAWFSYLLFILIYLAEIRNFIQPNFLSLHALEIGSVLEVVLLSLAFADRINQEKELRLQAQLERNQNLDQQVRARTEELEAANRKLKEISNTDALTGLYNRRYFDEVIALEYQRAFREKRPIAVIMVDLDHFKSVNDTHGHVFGDQCLQRLARIIRQCIKRPPDVGARYGGEEFVVLLPETDSEGARHVAETIRNALLEQPVREGEVSVQLTASFGVASEIPHDREAHTQLLEEADRQLYQAKAAGRNRVQAGGVTSGKAFPGA